MTAERRQITVLSAELIAMDGAALPADPEELRPIVDGFRRQSAAIVTRHGGSVVQHMACEMLAYFGHPVAQEDAAERAIRAGMALVHDRPEGDSANFLWIRVGIATGVVIADRSGEILGEAPSEATRLRSMADSGQVVVTANTRRLAGRFFEYRDLRVEILRGITGPAQAWQVLGINREISRFEARQNGPIGNLFKHRELGQREVKGFADQSEGWAGEGISVSDSHFESVRSGWLTGFVGREHEIGLLLERWTLAQGGEGQVVLLCGEPGIGKSRILSELRVRQETHHTVSLRFHCSPSYVNSAFYPIIDNFERALQFGRNDTADQKLDKLEALVVGQHGRPREDVRFIAAMLSIPYQSRYGAVTMTPQKFKDETLRALVDTVKAIAHEFPTVMLFEDAHWADPTTLKTLDLLIHRVRNIPLLVVITHRPEFSSRWSHHGHVTSLTLSRLTRPQSSAMVSRLAGGKALPADLLDQILGKTDGVPLFVEELTKSILESAQLRGSGDQWEYAGHVGTLAIPLTLRDSLMARLDRVSPVKEIAQIGAAIGREFSYALIAAVAPQAKPELDQALAQLVASGLAFQQGTPPDAVYTFKHALVQDAAYDSLPKRRRQELHGKIARVIEERFPKTLAIEPELLAHHYTEAKQPEKAIPLWQKAGRLALQRLALTEAIAHLNKGLDLVSGLLPSAERDCRELDLRTWLGTAWIALRGWPAQEVWDSLHPALELANSLRRKDALLPILWGLWANVITTGRVVKSLRWVTQMLDAAEAYHDPALSIVGHTAAVPTYFYLGELVKAREHAEQVLALYTEGQHGYLVDILNNDPKIFSLAWAAFSMTVLGYLDQAAKMSDAKDAHARRRGHPFDLGWALTSGAMVFDHLGEPRDHLMRLEEAERIGRENSLPFLAEVLIPISSGIAFIRNSQFAKGITSLTAGLAGWQQGGGTVVTPYLKSVLAEGIARLGDLDGALDLIGECIAQVERPGWKERWYHAETLRIRGSVFSLEGDLEAAEHNYIASLDLARQQQAKFWELRTATSYAQLMCEQGRVREAYDLLAPVYAWFTEGFETKDLKEAKALLDELIDRIRRETAECAAVMPDRPTSG